VKQTSLQDVVRIYETTSFTEVVNKYE